MLNLNINLDLFNLKPQVICVPNEMLDPHINKGCKFAVSAGLGGLVLEAQEIRGLNFKFSASNFAF